MDNTLIDAATLCSASRAASARLHDTVVNDLTSGADYRVSLESAQLETAEDLRKLREQYEADLKEQAKESCVNRWMSFASLIIAAVSLLVAIVK